MCGPLNPTEIHFFFSQWFIFPSMRNNLCYHWLEADTECISLIYQDKYPSLCTGSSFSTSVASKESEPSFEIEAAKVTARDNIKDGL